MRNAARLKTIPNLEMHITHSCNLACESCSHYSNQGLSGALSLSEAETWMQSWNSRLRPEVFSLLGGEPTLHPALIDFLILARKNWPYSQLRLATNGFFLHRHPRLPAVLKATQTRLVISIHHNSREYQEKLLPNLRLVSHWAITEGINVELMRSHQNWTRRYLGVGAAMEPFEDADPARSWAQCPAKSYPQLFEKQIWKCAPIAYLKLQKAKYPLSEKWNTYLNYAPLASDCTEAELQAFFAQREAACCGMCPANPERFTLPSPLQQNPARKEQEARFETRSETRFEARSRV